MEPLAIVPTKPDKEVAAEFRSRLLAALDPVTAIMDEAKRAGFDMAFSLNTEPTTGRTIVQGLRISKAF